MVRDMRDEPCGKPATAARIYDYHLGGVLHFVADVVAGRAVAACHPLVGAMARANRAFLRRAVGYLCAAGVSQLLDVGSGIPTVGNTHEIAQALVPEARVAYVDVDPVAVMESRQLLAGDRHAVAIRADVRDPHEILRHPEVTGLLDFDRPVGLLLCAVLHFVADDRAYESVAMLTAALAPGSHVVVSHAVPPPEPARQDEVAGEVEAVRDVYAQRTATPRWLRDRDQVGRFFTGMGLVEPGLVWLPAWRPAPDDPADFADDPAASAGLGGVARI